MRICGIDEAGRGPVIGPMVMAGVLIKAGKEEDLRELGVKDSKLLKPETREKLAHNIEEEADKVCVKILKPEDIDHAVMSESFNLNMLEAKTSAKILAELRPDKAVLDCPSTNPEAYAETVRRFLPGDMKDVEIIAEHKADVKYPAVSAASILAKVRRDAEIDIIRAELNEEIGSGYPADPSTKEFLRKNWKKHAEKGIFRKSWASWQELKEKEGQKRISEF